MTAINPTTGHKLSESELDAEAEAEAEASRTTIQRCLFQTPASTKVHVYNIPPLASNRGHDAATWTADDNNRMIFMARLRVLETAMYACLLLAAALTFSHCCCSWSIID